MPQEKGINNEWRNGPNKTVKPEQNIPLDPIPRSRAIFDLGINLPPKPQSNTEKVNPVIVEVTEILEKSKNNREKQKVEEATFSMAKAAVLSKKTTKPDRNTKSPKPETQKSTSWRFWQKIKLTLEFLVTTLAIFALLFLALNFNSYSDLFWSKIGQINGENGLPANPYSEQQKEKVLRGAAENQVPLPITHNVQEAKKQIPDLQLEIAPPDDRIIIPRINKNVPIIQVSIDTLIRKDWAALENQIQDALRHGVVHFPGTAYPGDQGNVVITGHSSYFPWDAGRFKDVFALLHQVSVGDEIVVYHQQVKHRYRVYEKKVVKPSQVEVLTQNGEDKLTLITCTPVGTDLNRLIVLAKAIK